MTNRTHSSFGTRHAALVGILFMLLLLPSPARGQAWTMPKGESYIKVSYGHVTAAEQYTFDGRATDYINGLPGDTFRDRSLYLYSEVGLTDNFTLVLSVPYKRTFVRDHGFRFRIFGLGSISVGGRISLLPLLGMEQKQRALAANFMAFVPSGYTRNFTPSTGAGQLDVQASLFFGQSLYPLPAYTQLGAGYRHRSSLYLFSQSTPCISGSDIHCITDPHADYGDELVFYAETGVSPFNGLLLLQGLANAAWSLDAPRVGFSAINPLPTHQRFIKAGAGVTVYPFKLLKGSFLEDLGLSAQFFRTLFGKNTINSRDLFLGIEYRPKLF